MYAIIEDSGTQIKVAPGDVVEIDLREVDDGKRITFDRVLLVGSGEGDDRARIGMPYLEGVTVTAEVVAESRGKKIDIVKYIRRKGYRKHQGHRQKYLKVKIAEING